MPSKERDRDRDRAYSIAYRKANPEKVKESRRAYHRKNREKINAYVRSYKYGVSQAEFQRQLQLQTNACANPKCRKTFSGPGDMHIDHEHASGTIRGILCRECNIGLGLFADDPARLRGAATYLEQGGYWGRTPPPDPATETTSYPLTYAWVEDE